MTTTTQEPRQSPGDIQAKGWFSALKRARPRMKELNISLLASGVAFWAMLSLFPAIIALVMVYGLVANPDDVTEQIENAFSGLSEDAKAAVSDPITTIASDQSSALSFGLIISLAVLLWSASSGMQNLMQALTTAYEQEETRGFVKLRATALVLSIGALLLAVVLIGVVGVVPPILEDLFPDGPLRWVLLAVEVVVLLLLLVAVVTALYRFAPANKPAGLKWGSTGAVFTAVLLVLFTVLFTLYVQNFGSYNKTYGALAGVIILMLWLYYSAYVLLIGALVNAEGMREAKGNAEAEPEGVDRDVVRSPNEDTQERKLRKA
jgi:membrane protein